MSDVVLPGVEVTPLDHVVAFLKKLGSYLSDPRTALMVVSIIMGLRVVGVFQSEISDQQVNDTLKVLTEVVLALTNLAVVLGPIWKYVDSITKRPSRGLTPWLNEAKAQKIAQTYGAAKG
jgi:hypothetical protein